MVARWLDGGGLVVGGWVVVVGAGCWVDGWVVVGVLVVGW